jgi:diaminopimelate epimerase
VETADWVDTGVPHAVLQAENLDSLDVHSIGSAVRFNEAFAPAGANADFIELAPDGAGILVRTYERGVEAETMACGTGIAASALSASISFRLRTPIRVQARSGDILEVRFTRLEDAEDGAPRFKDVHLVGPAVFVYDGVMAEGF